MTYSKAAELVDEIKELDDKINKVDSLILYSFNHEEDSLLVGNCEIPAMYLYDGLVKYKNILERRKRYLMASFDYESEE